MAKVRHFHAAESTLGPFHEQLVLLQHGEHEPLMLQMFRSRPAVDEDVIEEDKDEAAEEQRENVVRKHLEGHQRVRQAERHDQELEEPLVCPKRHLGDVIDLHEDLVVAETQVDLGEEGCAVEFI
jgi:hypothetical protein